MGPASGLRRKIFKYTIKPKQVEIIFFKGAQVGGEPGIFLIFVYFLSQAAP